MSDSLVSEREDTRTLKTILSNKDQVRTINEQNVLHISGHEVVSRSDTISESEDRTLQKSIHDARRQWRELEEELNAVRHHNTELLKTLDHQQSASDVLNSTNCSLRADLEMLQSQQTFLKHNENELATSAQENKLLQVKIESVEMEKEQLRRIFSDKFLAFQVELETLQDQLCARKEKQYQYLERTRQLEDQLREKELNVARMSQTLEDIQIKSTEMEAQWRGELQAKRNLLQVNDQVSSECSKLVRDKQELQLRMDRNEQEKSRLEADFRQGSEQLREMADKVFQLLERLKSSEVTKNRATDAYKHQQVQFTASEKRILGLQKEIVKMDQTRSKIESEKQVVSEQHAEMKRLLTQMSVRCTEQEKAKLRVLEERNNYEEKTSFLTGRVAHLLRKLQSEEEARQLLKEDVKKLTLQLASYQQRHCEVTQNLHTMSRNAQLMTQALRQCEDERNDFKARLDAAVKNVEEEGPRSARRLDGGQSDSIQSRFILEAVPSLGPNGITLKTRRSESVASSNAADEFLNRNGIQSFFSSAIKHSKPIQMLTEKIGQLLTRLMISEEKILESKKLLGAKSEELKDAIYKATTWKSKFDMEVDVKRRLLLRYVHQFRCQHEASGPGGGILRLTKSGIGDEEVHAIASLLHSQNGIKELHLDSNCITNEGARAIAAILSYSHCQLRHIDLRRNQIEKKGLQLIADALERHSAHLCVHSGRLDAFVDKEATQLRCVVDISDNTSPIPLHDDCKMSPIPDRECNVKARVESAQHGRSRSRVSRGVDASDCLNALDTHVELSPSRANAGCKSVLVEKGSTKEMRCKWNGAERKLPPLLLAESTTLPLAIEDGREDVEQEPAKSQ